MPKDDRPQVIRFDPELVQKLYDKVVNIMHTYVPNEDAKTSYISPKLEQTIDKIADYLDTLDVSLSLKHSIIKNGMILNTTKNVIKSMLSESAYAKYITTLKPIESAISVKEVLYNLLNILLEAITRQIKETHRPDLANPLVISQIVQTQILKILRAVANTLDLTDEIEKIIKETMA